jgi:RHS repeat-associated protein
MQSITQSREEYIRSLGIAPGPPHMKGNYADPNYSGISYPDGGTPSDTYVPAGWPRRVIPLQDKDPNGPPGAPIQYYPPMSNETAEPGFAYEGAGQIEESGRYFYHGDHLGSTSFVTDARGRVSQYVAYMPYGEALFEEHSNTRDMPYLFNAKERDEETGLYYYGARYLDPETAVWYGVDPLAMKYPDYSPYIYCANNPLKYIDPDGKKIKLAGTAAQRQTILTTMQKLTNDKLSIRSDGTVIIVRMGGENPDKALTSGSELIRDLNKKGDGARTVTISIGTRGNTESDVNPANAINGIGSDANVSFDPTSNPNILTKDPTTGNVSGATRPNEIGLGHELTHADRSMKGVAVDYSTNATHTYKDATGNTIIQTQPKEELETVGLQGNHKYNENKLRKEQGLNERGAY